MTRDRLSIALTIAYIGIITLSLVMISSVYATDIGATTQPNPYESNPNAGAFAGGTPTNQGGTPDLARDGKLDTDVHWDTGSSTTATTLTMQTFDNAPPGGTFTIGWVDIKVKYKAEATVDDKYSITFKVSPSAVVGQLQPNVAGAAARFDVDAGNAQVRAFSKVYEPNNGAWDWTDIQNLQVIITTQAVGSNDGAKIYIYEVWATVYSGTYPYSATIPLSTPNLSYIRYWSQDGDTVWDADEPAINDTNMNNVYNAGIDTVLTFNVVSGSPRVPTDGATLTTPIASIKYYDRNGDGLWTGGGLAGEPAISDALNPGYFDLGSERYGRNDAVLVGTQPPGDVVILPSKLQTLGKNTYFFIDVYVINMWKQHGFQFVIYFAPYVIKATEYFAYNPFISAAPSGFDNTAGWVSVAFSSWLGDPVGFTGSGPAARIYFQVVNEARSPLHFDTVTSTVSNVYGQVIPTRSWTDGVYWGPQWLTGVSEGTTPAIIDLAHPVGTNWHELFPTYSNMYQILYNQDNGDGKLSASDQIYMSTPSGSLWYHVDTVTTTIHFTFKAERHAENIATNGEFDAGEAIYRDSDSTGTVTAKDVLLSGPAQPIGTALVDFTREEKHTDNVIADGLYENGESIYKDLNGDGKISKVDVVLVGPEPPENSDLLVPGFQDTFDDLDFSGSWDVDEPAIRDGDSDFMYIDRADGGADYVLAMGTQTPTITDSLTPPGSNDKFYDTNGDYEWTDPELLGYYEPAIRDVNGDNKYNAAEPLIQGPAQPYDTVLRSFAQTYEGKAEPQTPMETMPPGTPIGSTWHQIYPPSSFCRMFTITSWEDTGAIPGTFDPSDQFDFTYADTPGITYWAHLDAVSTDIIITLKDPQPPPPPVPEFPLGLSAIVLLAPLIPIVYIWRLKKTKPKPLTTQIKPKGLKP